MTICNNLFNIKYIYLKFCNIMAVNNIAILSC